MKKKIAILLCAAVMVMSLAACGNTAAEAPTDAETNISAEENTNQTEAADVSDEIEEPETTAVLEDGIYQADFNTDSSMFHVNEANEGKGVLTVENGQMTIHVSLVSKNIVNLFAGTADEAQMDGAELLQPTTDTVTYSDGISEEVYGFDIPVPVIDEEFDVALIGTKGTWYDHKVSVSNIEKAEQ